MDTPVTIFHFCKCQLWRGLQTIPGGSEDREHLVMWTGGVRY